ncbi:MAG TPA: RNA-binding S4 domain-containing protein [Rhizomicrobium sp.]|nr:RNA-binding S4 domain-containing protein [Rhizomicrobium sp.]
MTERIRIDKWLWHARFYRTRPLAQHAAESGLVRLNGTRIVKSGHAIKIGDVLTVPQGREVLAVRVLAVGQRRGPAPEARLLYEIVAENTLDQRPPAP